MTAMALDHTPTTDSRDVLSAAESAVVGITAAIETLAVVRPAAGASTEQTPTVPLAPRPVVRGTSPSSVRPRLVPSLASLPRSTASTGPGCTRPPTIDERVLARRRAALAAERAALSTEETPAVAPVADPTSVCCSLVLAAVEALAGTRPLAQLARWVTPEVYEALNARAILSQRVLGTSMTSRRPHVRRVRLCRVGEHAAEAGVVVDDGRRVRAVAVRLETWRGAWRAVALEIG
jgi:hypothetical protein